MAGITVLEDLFRNMRLAIRRLAKSPVFTAVVIVTLALGIGANTAIFSVTNAILLRLLPVRHADRLVYLHTNYFPTGMSGYGDTSLSEPIFEALRTQSEVFSDLMAYAPLGSSRIAVRYGSGPEEAWVDMVSGNFFTGLGVSPLAGRVFAAEDESTHAPVAVVSAAYWQTRLGGSYSVLGEPIYIKGVPFTIVGIAARGFNGVEHNFNNDVWIPLQTNPEVKPWGRSPQEKSSVCGSPHWWFLLEVTAGAGCYTRTSRGPTKSHVSAGRVGGGLARSEAQAFAVVADGSAWN